MSALLAPASLQAMPPKKGRAKAEPKKKGEAATNAGLSQQGVATAATAGAGGRRRAKTQTQSKHLWPRRAKTRWRHAASVRKRAPSP